MVIEIKGRALLLRGRLGGRTGERGGGGGSGGGGRFRFLVLLL